MSPLFSNDYNKQLAHFEADIFICIHLFKNKERKKERKDKEMKLHYHKVVCNFP